MGKLLAIAIALLGTSLVARSAGAQPCTPFADDFETGDATLWDDYFGTPTVNAGLGGNPLGFYALRVQEPFPGGVISLHPNADVAYSADFLFQRNTWAVIQDRRIFELRTASLPILDLRLDPSGALRVRAFLDGGGFNDSSTMPVPTSVVRVRVAWRAATSAGANNGFAAFQIGSLPPVKLSGLDNDLLLADEVYMGMFAGAGGSGVCYFDDFDGRCDLSLLVVLIDGFESGGFGSWSAQVGG